VSPFDVTTAAPSGKDVNCTVSMDAQAPSDSAIAPSAAQRRARVRVAVS
jgi:hypothetical protein